MDKKKFTKDVNKATYFTVIFFSSLLLIKNKKRAPIEGNKINEDKMGKFIISLLRRLAKQKIQLASQMHIGRYNHFEIYLLLKTIF